VSSDRPLDGIRVVPADTVPWSELGAVFGTRGPASRCFCQRYKLARRESFAGFPAEERAARLREQAGCDDPGSGTSGLVADSGHQAARARPRVVAPGLLAEPSGPLLGREGGERLARCELVALAEAP